MTRLRLRAVERSTYVVRCDLTDEDGAAVVPTSLTWTLTDRAGGVVNSRQDVPVSAPAARVEIVLSGDDLAPRSDPWRVLTVEAVYTSSLGQDLPLKAACSFALEELAGV